MRWSTRTGDVSTFVSCQEVGAECTQVEQHVASCFTPAPPDGADKQRFGGMKGLVYAARMQQLSRAEVAHSSFGRPLIIRYRKFNGRPHRTNGAYYLGMDEHCHWVGCVAGETVKRSDQENVWHASWVVGFALDRNYTLNVNVVTEEVSTRFYSDMTSVPTWHEVNGQLEVRAIDLDLDVKVLRDGFVTVVDRDEFDEHQVSMNYPQDVIDAAEAGCEFVFDGFTQGYEPFVSVATAWRDRWVAHHENYPPHGPISLL